MAVVFDPYGIPGLLGFAATWAMAAFLWTRAGEGSANRHLAILLAAEGVAVLTTTANFLFTDPRDLYAAGILHFMADVSLPPLYLLFLSHALDVPWMRGLRSHAGHAVLWVLALAGPVLVVLFDRRFYIDSGVPGPWLPWHFVYVTAGFLFGIVAAIAAYRRARTPSARQRARAFLVAFTFFDLVWGGFYGSAAYLATQGSMNAALAEVLALVYAIATPIFVALLTYAILKVQLFDIELRIKIGIRRGTVALVFLIVFVAVAEIAQSFLSAEYGLAAGGVVAGILLVAIRPLERMADRVASVAMPTATGSPEYLAYKKLEVYRAAVESALEADGRIDDREIAKLDRLAAKLGVRPEDAAAVRRDALGAMAV